MASGKHIKGVCRAALALALLLTVLCFHLPAAAHAMGYESRLFDTSFVHTLDIVIDDWDAFLSTCESEEYTACNVVIDGEAYKNVGLRGKGNTSLQTVAQMGSSRYSLKLEFDHYDSGKSYYGLDKLCLNNLIQDNTYLKDYLTYQMMAAFHADAPLCSFVYITVNGEDWGLYLAVEGIEDGFLQRNGYTGELYKPDSQSAGKGGSSDADVKLQYIDDDPASYPNIFEDAKTEVTEEAKQQLIASLKALSSHENLDAAVMWKRSCGTLWFTILW